VISAFLKCLLIIERTANKKSTNGDTSHNSWLEMIKDWAIPSIDGCVTQSGPICDLMMGHFGLKIEPSSHVQNSVE
jgi:hypothetical protein